MDRRREFPDAEIDSWLEREIASCRFDDVRHGKRLGVLLEQLSERIGGSIPFACQDWAATKAAYRFFSNVRISEDKILAGHFLCTRERFASARGGPVLVLHDTSEFVYRSEENEAIGMVSKQRTRSKGRPLSYETSQLDHPFEWL
jgi:Transposase DNA-binding